MKFFKPDKQRTISQVLILSVIFGFSAGIVGQLVADAYLNPWPPSDYLFKVETNQNTNINIPELNRVKKFVGIQQDFEVKDSVDKVSPTLAGIYYVKKGMSGLSQVYLPGELKANSVCLTSDGWLMSSGKFINEANIKDLVAVLGVKSYPIQKIIKDNYSGVVFLKIEAKNLAVADLASLAQPASGQLIVALNEFQESIVTTIKNVNYRRLVTSDKLLSSTEQAPGALALNDALADNYLGAPVINLSGQVIGLIKEIDQNNNITLVAPINQFESIINGVFRQNQISRPVLGINYVDLAQTPGLDENLSQGLNQGALIYQSPKIQTPAEKAGLKINDIIISVDNQAINQNNNLTDLIQQYQAGDQIDLEIMRETKLVTIGIVLE
jgi:S1-C subfamily serine protease